MFFSDVNVKISVDVSPFILIVKPKRALTFLLLPSIYKKLSICDIVSILPFNSDTRNIYFSKLYRKKTKTLNQNQP